VTRALPVTLLVALALFVAACSQSDSAGTNALRTAHLTKVLPPRPSAGCGATSHRELTLAKQTLEVAGTTRWYLISTPAAAKATKPLPVVLDLHGLAEGATLEALTSQFGPLAQKDGFISVFPQGTGSPVSWDTDDVAVARNSDLEYVSRLLDQVESNECVDETRIYATGLSDGAFMTSLLACAMSNRIAAFAPVSGVQLPSPCATTRRVPILAFHGTADPILHFNGGIGTAVLGHAIGDSKGPAPSLEVPPAKLDGPGYPATVAAWAKRDGCSLKFTDKRIASQVILRTYPCPSGTAVEFYIILGGGHAWPGSKFSEEVAAITGPTTFEINATTIIWSFFERFQL
jgi:polyhydroxybutyrate depolymerase